MVRWHVEILFASNSFVLAQRERAIGTINPIQGPTCVLTRGKVLVRLVGILDLSTPLTINLGFFQTGLDDP